MLSIYPILNSPGIAADVLTYHNDNARTGWNPNEGVLSPSNVNASSFGRLFTLPVDGKVDAQPLYVSNAAVANVTGLHNLVIVATEHDSVYAFDTDTGALYWRASLVSFGETPSDDRGCGQVTPEIGITATPVIDRSNGIYGASGTIYVVAMSKSAIAYHQRLHALNLVSGQELAVGPAEIQASYPGTGPHNDGNGNVIFDPGAYKERPGLLLLSGIVYTAWSSHCDIAPYTGWIIGYDEKTLAQRTVLNVDPNGAPNSTFLSDGSGNSFWNSGAGPAADANGNIYALSANGPFDATLVNGFPSGGDYGDTFLKLSTQGTLAVSDYFTPFDQAADASGDTDLGSGGAVVLPDMIDASGRTRHLAVGAGKDGNIYLVDRDSMGKYIPGATSNSYIYQELVGALPGGEFATAAYFNGAVYYGPVGGALQRFTFTQARLNTSPAAATSTVFGYPGVTPSVSSSGNSAGIVWAYENPSGGGQAVLHAYDATNLTELYNSNQNPQRDQFGEANKFITPTVCNGKVFAGTTNSVGVFGLLNSPPPPTPTPTPTPTSTPTPTPIPPPPVSSITNYLSYSGDFNGDGKDDILWRNLNTGEVWIWLMNGNSIIGAGSLGNVDLSWKIVGIGDFNGGGKRDILWYNASLGEVAIWVMSGFTRIGNYGFPAPTSPTGEWVVTGVADFDHTGLADILWQDVFTGNVYLWKSVSPFNFGGIYLGTADPRWRIVGTADVEGNGRPDIVWRDLVTGEIVIWQLTNDRVSQQVSLGQVSLDYQIVGLADFNGNGKDDILWRSVSTGAVYVWGMNGLSIGAEWYAGTSDNAWDIVGTPRLFGGGPRDVLWLNPATGSVTAWLGSPTNFGQLQPFATAGPGYLPMPGPR